LPTTGVAASGWTSAPTAKNTAAGAMTAASTTGDLRRSLANSCRPTDSTVYQIVTFASRFKDPTPPQGADLGRRDRQAEVRLTTVFVANTPYTGPSKPQTDPERRHQRGRRGRLIPVINNLKPCATY
jgi:hypothetical protein